MVDRDLYMEIVDFLVSSGGAYRLLDSGTCQEVIAALDSGRYRLIRNEQGGIASFTTWWMIHEADLELVRDCGRPADVSSGSIVYIAEHAGVGAYPDLIRFLRAEVAQKGVCWNDHFWRPELFRYFPKKEGQNV